MEPELELNPEELKESKASSNMMVTDPWLDGGFDSLGVSEHSVRPTISTFIRKLV